MISLIDPEALRYVLRPTVYVMPNAARSRALPADVVADRAPLIEQWETTLTRSGTDFTDGHGDRVER